MGHEISNTIIRVGPNFSGRVGLPQTDDLFRSYPVALKCGFMYMQHPIGGENN